MKFSESLANLRQTNLKRQTTLEHLVVANQSSEKKLWKLSIFLFHWKIISNQLQNLYYSSGVEGILNMDKNAVRRG